MSLPVVAELQRTCVACPAQWEGKLEDGRDLYMRYRHGHLNVGVARQDRAPARVARQADLREYGAVEAAFTDTVGNCPPEMEAACLFDGAAGPEGDNGYASIMDVRGVLAGILEFVDPHDTDGDGDCGRRGCPWCEGGKREWR